MHGLRRAARLSLPSKLRVAMTAFETWEHPEVPFEDDYRTWRRYSEAMERYWIARGAMARRALEQLPESETGARQFARAYGLVTERERLWVRRYQLLMLLRQRASGGLR